MRTGNWWGSAPSLCVVLVAVLAVALSVGAVYIPFFEVFKSISGRGEALTDTLLLQLRLPRVLQAAVIGALLALTGALSQGLFRNPLADPSIIGVTGGASLGGALVLAALSGTSMSGELWVFGGAFMGGLAAAWIVYRLATGMAGTSIATLLLAGVAITALAGALVSLIEITVDNTTLRRVSLWRLGSLSNASFGSLTVASLSLGIIGALSLPLSSALNALLLGEAEAVHLGFRVTRVKASLAALIAAGMAVAVALSGAIAFIGLIVPHMVRLYCGPEHRRLLPRCALLGAILLVLADLFARTLLTPAELPLSVVTALLGVPYFLILLRRYRSSGQAL